MLTTSTLQPVLTKIAVAMLQEPKDFVGLSLFPLFRTELLSSTYWVVDPAAMVTAQPNMPRSPGTPFARSLTKLGSDVYSTEQYAHEETMGREENAKYARPGAAQEAATKRAVRVVLLGHERRVMGQCTGAGPCLRRPWRRPGPT